ncbi:ATP-dependent sacrificial sulfur transferase LarE [Sporolactobacillus shoreicorticis]|uniref:ATP-dependent sacrificial sulfur transferase LarE n=1 Tax=Sporolactobacillus shoreicorticis TaxID=1923877 RepID=A0ABW5S0Q3_9BACL|nr:ATP-dependent sacrificial sulfur transferase LarE [Sporolactobacillus shoreicorticis]MCO7125215.1 ATP-dependent sacrificial sulfur transferase LarE [Sporolactobacillus shoreicorticis]
MLPSQASKLDKLKTLLRGYKKIAIAFSGGVDSTFLLKVAQEELQNGALALTIQSPTVTEDDLKDVKSFLKNNTINYKIIQMNQLEKADFRHNSANRCYYCKAMEFSEMSKEAQRQGIHWLAAGINLDDKGDFRPGMRALKEIGVVSPLKEAGMTKADIRFFSKMYHLPTWNKPASACLASRVQYGEQITEEKLKKISEAEHVLKELNIRNLRVRYHHGNIARIEVAPEERQIFFDAEVMDRVAEQFRKIGFAYTTLDLQGYRRGSLNENLDNKTKIKVSMNSHV